MALCVEAMVASVCSQLTLRTLTSLHCVRWDAYLHNILHIFTNARNALQIFTSRATKTLRVSVSHLAHFSSSSCMHLCLNRGVISDLGPSPCGHFYGVSLTAVKSPGPRSRYHGVSRAREMITYGLLRRCCASSHPPCI